MSASVCDTSMRFIRRRRRHGWTPYFLRRLWDNSHGFATIDGIERGSSATINFDKRLDAQSRPPGKGARDSKNYLVPTHHQPSSIA
jgi:hypothetical protein